MEDQTEQRIRGILALDHPGFDHKTTSLNPRKPRSDQTFILYRGIYFRSRRHFRCEEAHRRCYARELGAFLSSSRRLNRQTLGVKPLRGARG